MEQSFEVFDSKGAFDMILGKPWLRAVEAIHAYATNTITIKANGQQAKIGNEGRRGEAAPTEQVPMDTEASKKTEEDLEETQYSESETSKDQEHSEAGRPRSEGEETKDKEEDDEGERDECEELGWQRVSKERKNKCQILEKCI